MIPATIYIVKFEPSLMVTFFTKLKPQAYLDSYKCYIMYDF
jgi:hypothetical protein